MRCIKIPINESVTLGQLNRVCLFEGMDILIENGKAFAILEVYTKCNIKY